MRLPLSQYRLVKLSSAPWQVSSIRWLRVATSSSSVRVSEEQAQHVARARNDCFGYRQRCRSEKLFQLCKGMDVVGEDDVVAIGQSCEHAQVRLEAGRKEQRRITLRKFGQALFQRVENAEAPTDQLGGAGADAPAGTGRSRAGQESGPWHL